MPITTVLSFTRTRRLCWILPSDHTSLLPVSSYTFCLLQCLRLYHLLFLLSATMSASLYLLLYILSATMSASLYLLLYLMSATMSAYLYPPISYVCYNALSLFLLYLLSASLYPPISSVCYNAPSLSSISSLSYIFCLSLSILLYLLSATMSAFA